MTTPTLYIDAIKMEQPIGEFYVGAMDQHDLRQISIFDMRRIENDLDDYIGIQRKLSDDRVIEIGKFVNTIDATFPTSVVLAVPGDCVSYDPDKKRLALKEVLKSDELPDGIRYYDMAKVLDGQHRIEGLKHFEGDTFDVPVTIIVNADLADQAFIFATVNLAQTKVNRSLVYDLLDYSKARSPEKSCHHIAVALNKNEESPFTGMIKRLGSATPGVSGETITQAAFVMSLLPMISKDPVTDRDLMKRGKTLAKPDSAEHIKMPFRRLFIEDNDSYIARNVSEYFHAIAAKWPEDWAGRDKGNILPRTNGFRAFMRFLKEIYLHLENQSNDPYHDREIYRSILDKVQIESGGFNTENFPPGTSGEKLLFDQLRNDTEIGISK